LRELARPKSSTFTVRQAHFDVRGLKIAMDNAFFVSCGECFGDLPGQSQHSASGSGPRERRCDSVSPSTYFRAINDLRSAYYFVHGHDVGMIQRRRGARFPLEQT